MIYECKSMWSIIHGFLRISD